MKTSHEAVSNIFDLTNLSQPYAPATAPKLQAQSEPQTIPNSATPQDPSSTSARNRNGSFHRIRQREERH
jgi:hypothetical protein